MLKIKNNSIIYPLPGSNLIKRVEENFEIEFPKDFISESNGTNCSSICRRICLSRLY